MRWWLMLMMIMIMMLTATHARTASDSLVAEMMEKPSAVVLNEAARAKAQGDDRRALTLYMIVRNRPAHHEQAKSQCALAFLRSGDIYYWKGHYSKALSLYVQGLKYCEDTKRKEKIIEFYKCFGNVYFMYKDYERAEDYYLKGYSYRKEYPDNPLTYRLLMNLCHTYYMKGEGQKMKHYYREALATPHDANPHFTFYERFYQALIDKMDHRYERAKQELSALVPYTQKHHLPTQYTCTIYEERYKIYEQEGKRDSMVMEMKRCVEMAERTHQLHLFTEPLTRLADIYTQRGKSTAAKHYGDRYRAIADSVFNYKEFGKARREQFEYEMGKIDRDIATLTATNESDRRVIRMQRIIVAGALLVVVVVVMLLLVVYRQNRNLRESYHNLYHLNRRMHDMHHQMVEGEGKYVGSRLADDKKQQLIGRINDVMENTQAYASDDFTLDKLAELTESNSKYVSQVINDSYQKNFSNFVNEYRIRLACSRLIDDEYANYTIRGIGSSVGYRSHTTFVNVFRKITGITPSAYQKMAREEQNEVKK